MATGAQGPESGGAARALLALGRASEWWEYKLLPALAVGYAVSLALGADPWRGLAGLGWTLLALVPGAVFVSLLNDWTDRSDDAAAGKPNRQAGRDPRLALALIALCLAAGLALGWTWRGDPLLLASYAAGWIAYTLYSLPPFRFKTRGAAGVLCDAIGANLVPALLAAQLTARALGAPLPPALLAAVAVWSLMFGLRGILWHQIGDLEADRRAGAPTFVARHGAAAAEAWTRRLVFPLELAGLAALVALSGLPVWLAAGAGLMLYAGLIHERIDRFDMTVTLVRPHPRGCLALHEYYDVFLPLALLVAGLWREPLVLVVLAAHLVLFPVRVRQVLSDVQKIRSGQYHRRPKP